MNWIIHEKRIRVNLFKKITKASLQCKFAIYTVILKKKKISCFLLIRFSYENNGRISLM